jgi:phage-related protein
MLKKLLVLSASVVLAACAQEDVGPDAAPEDTAEASGALRTHQGRTHQGRTHQGTVGGTYSVTSVLIGGAVVENLELNATTLVGTLAGQAVSGDDFLGAQVIQVSQAGDFVQATIDAIDIDPTDPSGETSLYSLSVVNETTGLKGDMCQPDASGVAKAIPVPGSWTESGAHEADGRITFGCLSGVIAKCVRWGYRPWESAAGGASMTDYHQACTRMARADYCATGESFTQDGTEIDFYDALGVNVNTASALMLFDGAWSPDGAYCIGKERWLKLTSVLNLLSPTCKSRFALTLLTTSPVSSADVCLVKRGDVPRSSVLMDNRSFLNLSP